MKKLIFTLLTKLEYVDYGVVILIWIGGAVATIMGFPWITLGIVALHAFECITIGIPTGRRAGEPLIYSMTMCMIFGFLWWVPLKMKTGQVDFD